MSRLHGILDYVAILLHNLKECLPRHKKDTLTRECLDWEIPVHWLIDRMIIWIWLISSLNVDGLETFRWWLIVFDTKKVRSDFMTDTNVIKTKNISNNVE